MKCFPHLQSYAQRRTGTKAALLTVGLGLGLASTGLVAQASTSHVLSGLAQSKMHAVVAASESVSSKLSAWKVEEKDGKEALTAAGKVAPGDVIEYRVEYRNAGSKDVRDLIATLPIPSTMSYVERTTRPTKAQASTNGRSYAPVPLRRRVKGADGSTNVVAVPVGQYRFLRWNVPVLAAGKSISFTARARVNQ